MNPRRNHWTPEQDALLAAFFPHSNTRALQALLGLGYSAIANRAHGRKVQKSAWFRQHLAHTLDGIIGERTRFKPGQQTWNKGKKGWQAGGRAHETKFKPGTRPRNWKPVGTTRETNGTVEIKMAEGMRRWRILARIVWERCNGSIPRGHVVAHIDGDWRNNCITNLRLMSLQQNMLRNSYHQYGKEIAQCIQLQGQITRQINRMRKQA